MIVAQLTHDLQVLIDQIQDARASRTERRQKILASEPTDAGASELAAIDKHFEHLRLAEDVLQDAIKGIRAIDPEDVDPWDALVVKVVLVSKAG
jgi:hypothetical protein